MTSAVIITLCALLLLAYLFDLTSVKTRIPSVILLLVLGWAVQELTLILHIEVPDLKGALPILGTIGLILIVLEGSLELELKKSRVPLIVKSFLGALVPILLLSFGLAYAFQYQSGAQFTDCLLNAIPLSVISSAVAISSTRGLAKLDREFVVYESSLSDIIGVLLFNFIALNDSFTLATFGTFGLQLLLMLAISLVCVGALSYLIGRIKHHVSFAPIILLVILIYAIAKEYHLPALVFILMLGLCLGNLDELIRFKLVRWLAPQKLDIEVRRFKELTYEATFLIRSLFFLLFGFLISTADLLNMEVIVWSVGIVAGIVLLRTFQLWISGQRLVPLLFMAPRGLITILLFLSIPVSRAVPVMNDSLVLQVIVLTALLMMLGSLLSKPMTSRETNRVDETLPPDGPVIF